MEYEIDQSGKVEDTAKLTIVAFANGKVKTLMIKAVEKRKLIRIMKKLTYPRKTFIYQAFAGFVYLLLKGEDADYVVIDKEYPGHEASIKGMLLQLFDKAGEKRPEVNFAEIGKESTAHKVAIETFQGKRKPDVTVKAEDVLRLFYNDKSWRSLTG